MSILGGWVCNGLCSGFLRHFLGCWLDFRLNSSFWFRLDLGLRCGRRNIFRCLFGRWLRLRFRFNGRWLGLDCRRRNVLGYFFGRWLRFRFGLRLDDRLRLRFDTRLRCRCRHILGQWIGCRLGLRFARRLSGGRRDIFRCWVNGRLTFRLWCGLGFWGWLRLLNRRHIGRSWMRHDRLGVT
jgi:hypothetical protein